MKVLTIDTTTAKLAKITLTDSDKIVGQNEADNPLSAISILLEKTGVKLEEIERFDSNPGPGSYTGVRVGAVVANTLNWVLGNKVPLIEPVYE